MFRPCFARILISISLLPLLFVVGAAPAVSATRTPEALATDLVASMRAGDAEAFAGLFPDPDEFQTWAQRELSAEDRAGLDRDWYTQHYQYLKEDFGIGLELAAGESLGVPSHCWRLAGHGFLVDHDYQLWDDSCRMMYLDLEASWMDAPPLSFRLEFQVAGMDDRYFLLNFEMYPVEIMGPELKKLLLAVPEAIIAEDLPGFSRLLAQPQDILWYVDNRFPADMK